MKPIQEPDMSDFENRSGGTHIDTYPNTQQSQYDIRSERLLRDKVNEIVDWINKQEKLPFL